MNSTAEETQNYFVGTNSSPRYVTEALRQGIISADESLLGIFDGIFYDSDNKRVGGIALNDFLVITDRAVVMWARDQHRDYVDRFPLSHTFVNGHNKKEGTHATLKLALVLPEVAPVELAEAERLNMTFDLVPLADIDLLAGLLDVLGSAHRDLINGGAGEEDRYKATRVLFTQVFLSKFLDTQETGSARPKSQYRPPEPPGRTYDLANEPIAEFIDDDEAEAFMTPLSRLDQLDSFSHRATPPRPRESGAMPYAFQPQGTRQTSRPYANSMEESSARLYRAEPDYAQGYYSSSATGQASAIEQELRWMGQAQPPSSRPTRRDPASSAAPTSGPGTRLRDELNNSEAVYVLGRAKRAMFDNLDKVRRDAESKSMGLVPFLSTLRDSGMNVRDLTEFMVAANDLLDTVGKNPAARELAMMFASRAMNDAGKIKPNGQAKVGRGPAEAENSEAKEAAPPPRQGARVKVERRNKPRPVVELEDATSNEESEKLEVKLGGSQTRLPEIEDEPEVEQGTSSQTALPKIEAKFEAEADFEDIPVARPVRHRLSIRGNNPTAASTAGAADGGSDKVEVNLETAIKFSAPRGPDLN